MGCISGISAEASPCVVGGLIADNSEDQLKALGAAAASSGAVAMFHAVGLTPEAPTLDEAFHGYPPETIIPVTLADLRVVRDQLSTVADGPINAVALGSPHFSLAEFAQLLPQLQQFPPHPQVEFIVCTNRFVLAQLEQRGWREPLQQLGVQVVVDTCVVVTPIVKASSGVLMTNSGKFAHYTPGNIGLQVVYGSLTDCVVSAHAGSIQRDEAVWSN